MVFDRQITDIKKKIQTLREEKGKSIQTIRFIDKVLVQAHDMVVDLMLEKHILYQHIVMEEDAKAESQRDEKKRKIALKNMEKVTLEALGYVTQNKLNRWQSRVYRCMGRVSDYKKNYRTSIMYYKKAMKLAIDDPEVVNQKVPRQLEYKAFLSFSIMMSGEVEKGIKTAKRIYGEFDKSEGKRLKLLDYPTWAIWKSGIPIRTIKGLIELGKDFNKEEMFEWLRDAEKLLEVPKGSTKWVGKTDFGFRKDEISMIKNMLI